MPSTMGTMIFDLVIKLDDLYLIQIYDERVEPTPHQREAAHFTDITVVEPLRMARRYPRTDGLRSDRVRAVRLVPRKGGPHDSIRVCPCISCHLDAERGEPLTLVQFRLRDGTRPYWSPHHKGEAGVPGNFALDRNQATAFGPRHLREMGDKVTTALTADERAAVMATFPHRIGWPRMSAKAMRP